MTNDRTPQPNRSILGYGRLSKKIKVPLTLALFGEEGLADPSDEDSEPNLYCEKFIDALVERCWRNALKGGKISEKKGADLEKELNAHWEQLSVLAEKSASKDTSKEVSTLLTTVVEKTAKLRDTMAKVPTDANVARGQKYFNRLVKTFQTKKEGRGKQSDMLASRRC